METQNPPTSKRGRGPTVCRRLANLREGEKLEITFIDGQPVGDTAATLTSYCGVVARDGQLLPIHHSTWHAVGEKPKIVAWTRVLDKFDIHAGAKIFVLATIGKKWRTHKNKLKGKYYISSEDPHAIVPPRVVADQWHILVEYWDSEEANKIRERNKANRSKQNLLHTSGTKSFARVRHEERQKRSVEPSRADIFIKTHVNKQGQPMNNEVADKIHHMQELLASQPEGSQDSTSRTDVYSQVMGPERHGRVRGLGFGVSPTSVFGSSSTVRDEEANDLKSEVKQMKKTYANQIQEYEKRDAIRSREYEEREVARSKKYEERETIRSKEYVEREAARRREMEELYTQMAEMKKILESLHGRALLYGYQSL